MPKKTAQRKARAIEQGALRPLEDTIADVQRALGITAGKIVDRMMSGELDSIALQTVVKMVGDLAMSMERLGNAGAATLLGLPVERVVTLNISGLEPIRTKIDGGDNEADKAGQTN